MSKTIQSHLIDVQGLRARFDRVAGNGDPTSDAVKLALLDEFKQVIAAARSEVEALLLEDGGGTACASRLSNFQDRLITAAQSFAAEKAIPQGRRDPALSMAVIAVGGYGRGTLAPGSDIDLLFIAPSKPGARFKRIVEHILYFLWDLGFKVGHATRSVDECIRLSKSDMTIRTAVLEARLITGDEKLFAELVRRFDAEVINGTAAEFATAKLAERDERHLKEGASRYLVEPNIKDGKGGLRDLQTLFWIGKYVYRTRSTDDLLAAGVFSRRELKRFLRAEDFLWAIRCNLHFMTDRAEERLSFELQRQMAERLGYTDHPGLEDVERFMKHYFLVAKDVGDLTRIFCAELEEQHVKQAPRLLGRRKAKAKALAGTSDLIIDNDRINMADAEVFSRDPVNLIRIFCLADKTGLSLHPDATQAITRALKYVDADLRKDPEANRLFLQVVTSPRTPEATLRAMNETGVLGRFIPEFGKIVAMMQYSMYHHYTVDEHLIRTVGELSRIEHGDLKKQHPLIAEILPKLKDRTVLYVAALLHDIAKGRPEDHSIAGARVARRLCPRLGLSEEQSEMVAWLIEQHLFMSTVAQRRDLQDPKTIQDFVAVVQDIDRLRLLLILTVIDIRAVGPGVWNGWKGQLLRTLYWEAEPRLTGGYRLDQPRDAGEAGQGGTGRGADRLVGGRTAALCRAALSGLSPARRHGAQAGACQASARAR